MKKPPYLDEAIDLILLFIVVASLALAIKS
jgi:hypothetical protein